VTFSFAVLMLAHVAEAQTNEQISELEERLRKFPPLEVIKQNLSFSDSFIRSLTDANSTVPADRREAYTSLVREAERLNEVWLRLRYARGIVKSTRQLSKSLSGETMLVVTSEYINCSKVEIARLKAALSAEDFRAGRMPPSVPYWRFKWN
jgi:hypothetical protein